MKILTKIQLITGLILHIEILILLYLIQPSMLLVATGIIICSDIILFLGIVREKKWYEERGLEYNE